MFKSNAPLVAIIGAGMIGIAVLAWASTSYQEVVLEKECLKNVGIKHYRSWPWGSVSSYYVLVSGQEIKTTDVGMSWSKYRADGFGNICYTRETPVPKLDSNLEKTAPQ